MAEQGAAGRRRAAEGGAAASARVGAPAIVAPAHRREPGRPGGGVDRLGVRVEGGQVGRRGGVDLHHPRIGRHRELNLRLAGRHAPAETGPQAEARRRLALEVTPWQVEELRPRGEARRQVGQQGPGPVELVATLRLGEPPGLLRVADREGRLGPDPDSSRRCRSTASCSENSARRSWSTAQASSGGSSGVGTGWSTGWRRRSSDQGVWPWVGTRTGSSGHGVAPSMVKRCARRAEASKRVSGWAP